MKLLKKEAQALVCTSTGLRPFDESDLPQIRGFLLFGQGFGDILCMTPMIEEALQILNRDLVVWTRRPEVFEFHPRVRAHFPDPQKLQEFLNQGNLLFVSPVGTEQDRFDYHLVEHSANGIVDLGPEMKQLKLHSSEAAKAKASRLLSQLAPGRKKIVIHPSQSIPLRTWPAESWTALANELVKEHSVICVGKEVSYDTSGMRTDKKSAFRLAVQNTNYFDWIDQLSLHELYEVIQLSDLVITIDGGVLHVANATETPIVAFFTDVDPRNRIRFDARGKLGHLTTVVSAACPFQYCATSAGYNDDQCRLSGKEWMKCLPSVAQILDATKQVLESSAASTRP